MRISVLTLFPEMFESVFSASMLGKAVEKGIISFQVYDIRDHAKNKHRQADDYPFGGGAGMVMMPQPVFDCMEEAAGENFAGKKIFMSPRGAPLNDALARRLAREEHLIILCGHYEGVDQRAIDALIDMEISIGDYVLTGGELPAMVLIDCVSRFVPGVLGGEGSAEEESFADGLLEYPQYTRPAEFRGMKVPEVLLSGNHAEIKRWRRKQALLSTKKKRPDLLTKAQLSQGDKEMLEEEE
ncbi:MAG: tRNA (guanosine(37)-N1)-methyltransferase TrmD [Bacillota bacterium]|nr:tRNA (guanosine(37)-N1)-methyltransferase TrmD [Bacillota bacterium]